MATAATDDHHTTSGIDGAVLEIHLTGHGNHHDRLTPIAIPPHVGHAESQTGVLLRQQVLQVIAALTTEGTIGLVLVGEEALRCLAGTCPLRDTTNALGFPTAIQHATPSRLLVGRPVEIGHGVGVEADLADVARTARHCVAGTVERSDARLPASGFQLPLLDAAGDVGSTGQVTALAVTRLRPLHQEFQRVGHIGGVRNVEDGGTVVVPAVVLVAVPLRTHGLHDRDERDQDHQGTRVAEALGRGEAGRRPAPPIGAASLHPEITEQNHGRADEPDGETGPECYSSGAEVRHHELIKPLGRSRPFANEVVDSPDNAVDQWHPAPPDGEDCELLLGIHVCSFHENVV